MLNGKLNWIYYPICIYYFIAQFPWWKKVNICKHSRLKIGGREFVHQNFLELIRNLHFGQRQPIWVLPLSEKNLMVGSKGLCLCHERVKDMVLRSLIWIVYNPSNTGFQKWGILDSEKQSLYCLYSIGKVGV